jgi:hypothetical protein
VGGGKGVRHDGRAIAIQRQRCPRPGPAVSADAAQGQLVLVEKREKEEGSETEHLPPSSERLGQGNAWAPAEDIQLTRRDHCARGARAGKYQAAHSIHCSKSFDQSPARMAKNTARAGELTVR